MSDADQAEYLHTKQVFQLSDTLSRDIQRLRPQKQHLLHYTSLDAFYNIMESGRVRLSSVKSTNDPSEFLFGVEVVQQGLREARSEARDEEQPIIDRCADELINRNFKAFVFCMSKAIEDESEVGDLNQWRLYGADGRGIALLFDISTQPKWDELQTLISIPRRVIYGEKEGASFVKEQIQEFFNNFRSLPKETQEYMGKLPDYMSGYLGNVLFWLPSVLKHKAYRHEREIRLIRGDIGEHAGNPLVFNDKGTIRRPSIELPISNWDQSDEPSVQSSPISRVIIGPSGDQAAIEDSVSYFLEARQWDANVRRSDIPYRAV